MVLRSNVTKVPSNVIKQINDLNSKLIYIEFILNVESNWITIKPDAFQILNALRSIKFSFYSSMKFEIGAFKLSQNNHESIFSIVFDLVNAKGN